MDKKKSDKIIKWLKQPSSIKAIIMLMGLVGVAIDPDKLNEIVTSAIVLYSGVAAFYDKN